MSQSTIDLKDAPKIYLDEMRKLSVSSMRVPFRALKLALIDRGVSAIITTKDSNGKTIRHQMTAAQANRTLTGAKRWIAAKMISGKLPAVALDRKGTSGGQVLRTVADPKPKRPGGRPKKWTKLTAGKSRTSKTSQQVLNYDKDIAKYDEELEAWNHRLDIVLTWLFSGEQAVFRIGQVIEDPKTFEGREDFFNWISIASGKPNWDE